MTTRVPSIFIGSSSESLSIAEAIQENLSKDHDAVIWGSDIFELGDEQFESLVRATMDFDFAVFVADSDDVASIRGQLQAIPRDNVIFEVGLFIGALGKQRVFVVKAEKPDSEAPPLHLPTDLVGINTGRVIVRDPKHLASAVAPVSRRIAEKIKQTGLRISSIETKLYVAAVCYKVDDQGLRFRLVQTSRGRRMFPKSKIFVGESTSLAALRCAGDEAGVVGAPEFVETKQFRYLKEDEGVEQAIVSHIIRTKHEIRVDEAFRDPAWFSFADAEVALSTDRSARWAGEVRAVLKWAKDTIEENGLAERHMGGAIALRKTSSGDLEVLLISSRADDGWVIPKGAKEEAENFHQTAIREALEEGGVVGRVVGDELGEYSYVRYSVKHIVKVYLLRILEERQEWKEKDTRTRRWFSLSSAMSVLPEPSLRTLFEKVMERTDEIGLSMG